MTRDIDRYASDYEAGYGFERVLVGYRRQVVLERLRELRPEVVLEIGCGPDLLYRHFLRQAAPCEQWLIVEPAASWSASAAAAGLPGLQVLRGFVEEREADVRAALLRVPDVVVCSGVLQEVPSAARVLSILHGIMGPASILHANVANAASFHRRLALAMRLIPALDAFSELNLKMQQNRVYDLASLTRDCNVAGLEVVRSGGYLVKPFTHAQMEAIAPVLTTAVLDGLFKLGRQHPEWACEIFVEARHAVQ